MAPVSCDYFLSVCYDGIHIKTYLQDTRYGGSLRWAEVCNAKEVRRREGWTLLIARQAFLKTGIHGKARTLKRGEYCPMGRQHGSPFEKMGTWEKRRKLRQESEDEINIRVNKGREVSHPSHLDISCHIGEERGARRHCVYCPANISLW